MRPFATLLAVLLMTAACGGAREPGTAPVAPSDAPSSATTGAPPAGGSPPPATAPPTDPPAVTAAWRSSPLRDVRSGESFTIDELAGKVVVIEPMAIWCVNCGTQQREAAEALERLGSDDVVYISLDVDPTELEPDLAAYADDRGFGWRFVVASRDVARSLAETFGDQVLSPPSTPSIVVRPDGEVEGVTFGIQSDADLEAEISALLP